MKTTNRLFSLFAALLTTASLMAAVVYEPLIIKSGFNRDIIAETTHIAYDDGSAWSPLYDLTGSNKHTSCSATKDVMVAINRGSSQNYQDDELALTERCGWPNDYRDTVWCDPLVCTNNAYRDVKFLLGRYDTLNALCLRPETGFQRTGMLHFQKRGCYNKLYFLMISLQEGGDKLNRRSNVRLYFTKGTTIVTKDTTFNFGGLSASDAENNKFRLTNIYEYSDFRKNLRKNTKAYACVYDIDIADSLLLDSIWFENPKVNSSVSIYAITGRTAEIAAPDAESTTVSGLGENSFEACWDAISDAASYRLDVAQDPDFQLILADYNNLVVSGTTCQEVAGLIADNDYYWRVRSVNSDGGQSASSPTRCVRTAGNNPPETSETSENIEEMLEGYAGYRAVVPSIKIHRTLCRNGYFNTLCLPFNMNAEQIAASPIAGARVFEYVRATKTGEGLDIEINGPIDHINAGVPYLVNWEPTTPEWIGEDGLVFENVNITTYKGDTIGNNDEVQFIGNIGIANLVELDENNLFLGANNTLYYPEGGNRLKGFRSYFKIPSSGKNAVAKHTPARIVTRSETTTDIISVTHESSKAYKVLINNNLYIIQNSVMYNLQGQLVK